MKKFFAALLIGLIALSGVVLADVWDTNSGPYISKRGSKMQSGSVVALGVFPGNTSVATMPCIANGVIEIGDVVAYSSTSADGIAVETTTTPGDEAVLGIAVFPRGVTTVASGEIVQVALLGVAIVNSAVSVTQGDLLCASGTARKLTLTSSLTLSLFTSVSRTPSVVMALEDKTFGVGASGGLVRGIILPR